MNGINGCCGGCHRDNEDSDGRGSGQSCSTPTGIGLLCEAANAIEAKKCRQHMNGLIVNKSLLSDDSISGEPKPQTNSCDCHQMTSTPSPSSALIPCSTSSAILSCDINRRSLNESVHKDVNCLSNILSTDLTISELNDNIMFTNYESERQMPDIMQLIQKDLSEPYSIYTYRYFIHNWPHLCFLAMDCAKCVGAIVCKLDLHKKMVRRGYIAMLAVDQNYRKRRIGSNLVLKAIQAMICGDADEVVLETEVTNKPALQLYENLGFVRDKRLFRYYLNGVDALRLKLWLK